MSRTTSPRGGWLFRVSVKPSRGRQGQRGWLVRTSDDVGRVIRHFRTSKRIANALAAEYLAAELQDLRGIGVAR